jgi:hypothetical protein
MAARQQPRPSPHLRRFSKAIPYDWWGVFVRAAGSVIVADVARELRLGPYAFDDDLPNPFERILGVWEAGYNWQGETSEPAGARTAWVMELRADDFGGRPAL